MMLALATAVLMVWTVLSPPPVNPAVNPDTQIERHLSVPPQVMAILRRACYDCHSHETRWPWYSRLPLASRMLASDARLGRADVNFSGWSADPVVEPTPRQRLGGICYDATRRIMPPAAYLLLHPTARLTDADVQQICDWTDVARANLESGTGAPR